MQKPVFLHYDQAGLDAEYDNRGKVPDYPDYLKRFVASSEQARSRLPGSLGVSYGQHVAQHLDVFPAADDGAAAQIFIHGGYWTRLSKEEFSFVANGFRPHGITTVVIDYGLIPMVAMATQVEHCREAVAYVYRNAKQLGIDPARIHVCGHSAGAHLATLMAATDWADYLPDMRRAAPIRTVCGFSGLYDLEPIRLSFLNQDLSLSAETVQRFSPARVQRSIDAPVLLAVGELEGPEYLRQSNMLADMWNDSASEEAMSSTITALDLVRNDNAVHTLVHDGTHHFSIVEQLGDPDSAMVSAAVAHMDR